MNTAGIDYSMTCPSITVGNGKEFQTFYYIDKKKYVGNFDRLCGVMIPPHDNQMERFENIAVWALTILKKMKVTQVCLEGYSMGSKGQVFNIAENTGILKYLLYKANIEVYTPSPTSVKKHFAGKGNAKKGDMHQAYVEKTGFDPAKVLDSNPETNPVSDIVDSYAMLCYGIDNYFK